ncbi:MAG TPA: FixH family protein [Dissulfurispiraceae bacterium]|nr:FixH family protein [Dissulfurispiraceae bacterium]
MRYFIVVIVLVGLAAVAGSIIVGNQYFDGLVIEKPYEMGLAWDQRRHENEAAGWKVDVANKEFVVGKNEIILSVRDGAGDMLKDADVSIAISRPSTKQYDNTFKAAWSAGFYKASVVCPLYGYWDLKVVILKDSRQHSYEQRIFADKEVQR